MSRIPQNPGRSCTGAVRHARICAGRVLKPFVLAPRDRGSGADAGSYQGGADQGGFIVAGSYSPYPGAAVIGVTNDELRATRQIRTRRFRRGDARCRNQGQGSGPGVLHQSDYLANAYRMAGAQGLPRRSCRRARRIEGIRRRRPRSSAKLRKYHYTFGMEYFDEAEHPGQLRQL